MELVFGTGTLIDYAAFVGVTYFVYVYITERMRKLDSISP